MLLCTLVADSPISSSGCYEAPRQSVCVRCFPPPLPNVTQFIAFSLHWSTEAFDSWIFFFCSCEMIFSALAPSPKGFFSPLQQVFVFLYIYIYIIVLIGQFRFCSINFLFSLMTGLECFPSKNTVRHTHPVELPRWVRRLSHASELPSHSIYCGDYTKRKKKMKWKENPIKCHLFLSHWVHPDSLRVQ